MKKTIHRAEKVATCLLLNNKMTPILVVHQTSNKKEDSIIQAIVNNWKY